MRHAKLSVLVAVATFALIGAAKSQEVGPLVIAKQGYFFVGGKYVDTTYGHVTIDQAYVEYQIPQNRTQPWPVVMIAGGGMSGANFTGTPDGRDGWAQYFLARGYAVYVIDQVGRGRAAYVTPVYGPPRLFNAKFLEEYFIAPERYNLWPQARLHTQWPGSGTVGDPIFDQLEAQRLPDMGDLVQREELNRDATAALLDKIGPAILMTHSQSGAYSWAIADVRPALVKGIVGIEAGGPPFYEVLFEGAPNWFKDGKLTKRWGLNYSKVTYAPAAADPSELAIVQQEKPYAPNLVRCWLQKEPARRLPNLKGIPILLLTTEASFHVTYDHCASLYLKQAGVDNDFIRLPDLGIHGNGHYMMFEKNSMQIAGVIADWLQEKVGVAVKAQ
jgi:pimeloyl-ACP methyl ester carboxylesterase